MTSEEFMVEKVSGMQEDDATRQQRLIDLFDLYKRNSTAEVVDRIQNLLSTCLKLLVSEVDVQNNVTIGYMSFLTKTHMVLAVIKRDWNTLQSLVSIEIYFDDVENVSNHHRIISGQTSTGQSSISGVLLHRLSDDDL